MSTVSFTIDGKTCHAESGRNLVLAARENGVYIPSLCYFPQHDPPLGTCRVCTCRINGKHEVACTAKVHAGMEVAVNASDLQDLRRALVRLHRHARLPRHPRHDVHLLRPRKHGV